MQHLKENNLLYLEPFSGISGDMFLGSLLNLGLDRDWLTKTIQHVLPSGTKVRAWKEKRKGISGTRFSVNFPKNRERRNLEDIFELLDDSGITEEIVAKSKEMFDRLARVEAEIHGKSKDEIHFHELGGIDSIADIVGATAAVHKLQLHKVYSAPVNVGCGVVDTNHEKLPVPAPATAELLRSGGVPTYSEGEEELTTPTGALIMVTFVDEFIKPSMKLKEIGYGLGSRKIDDRGNFLRTTTGYPLEGSEFNQRKDPGAEILMETNIDDMNPEFYPKVEEKLLDAGALDVFKTAISMKKNRPGIKLSVICNEKDQGRLAEIIFRETTTLGIRIHRLNREKLKRELKEVETDFGKVKVKVGYLDGRPVTISPEFESCRRLAEDNQLSIKKVYRQALSKANQAFNSSL